MLPIQSSTRSIEEKRPIAAPIAFAREKFISIALDQNLPYLPIAKPIGPHS